MDFFPPIVDDPYIFGQIAAANALSDIYAMGGIPKTAMNLICIPSCMDLSTVESILQGGYNKVREAGAIIVGGHTIEDNEPKYGLCVTGFCHPKKILANATAKEGDVLVLTKSLGTGVLSVAYMADHLGKEDYETLIALMTRLNRYACEAFEGLNPHACTDITGFGLLGHGFEMAKGSHKTLRLNSSAIPIIQTALELSKQGTMTGGARRNRAYVEENVAVSDNVSSALCDILYDPQTSGGLLVALSESEAQTYLKQLESRGEKGVVIGEVVAFDGKYIHIY